MSEDVVLIAHRISGGTIPFQNGEDETDFIYFRIIGKIGPDSPDIAYGIAIDPKNGRTFSDVVKGAVDDVVGEEK